MFQKTRCWIAAVMVAGLSLVVSTGAIAAEDRAERAMSGQAFVGRGSDVDGALDRKTFTDPPPRLRSKFFWAWPGGAVQHGQLTADIEEMSRSGFGGGLIFPILFGLPPAAQLPAETFEWGQPSFAESVRVAAESARENEFTLDTFLGPGWPLASPAVSGENSRLAAQDLRPANVAIKGPARFEGAPPAPAGANKRLVAVTAARVVARPGPEGNILLDPDSAVDLTSAVGQDGRLRWDVPEGDWLLFGFWQFETGQGTLGWPAEFRAVDHLSREAVDATMDYFEERVLDPSMNARTRRAVLEQTHTDSYEIFQVLMWTHDFLQEFRERRGYDLRPYLPVLFVPGQHNLLGIYYYCRTQRTECTPPPATHDFPGDAGDRVRRDYYQTFTDLWVDEHLGALRERSHRLGATFAAEPYGLTADVIAGSKAVDVPMTEDHWNRSVDFMRTVASGANLSGARKASIEVGTAWGRDYMTTLQEIKRRADRAFVAGVNELVLHLYPHQVAPASTWPSWHPFSTEFFGLGFGEGWTPEMPVWRHMKPLADYFGRAQAVLQSGRPVSDVAVYRNWYGYSADPDSAADPPEMPLTKALSNRGYGFDFINPDTIEQASTRVRNRRLAPITGHTGYRAMVVDLREARGMGVTNGAMAPASAGRLVEFARSGLPIVFVGALPERGVSFKDPEGEDAAVMRAVENLRRSGRVRVVPDAAAVPGALADLGVIGDLAFDTPQNVYSVHRRVDGADYWFLWNNSDQPARFAASFRPENGEAPERPERWDLWTGGVDEVGRYRESGDRIELPVELNPLETTLLVFRRGSRRHVVDTDADDVRAESGRLLLRSTRSGTRTALLSDGTRRSVRFPALPDPIALDEWDLHIDGAVPQGTESHDITLTELRDWREIPQLADTSGTGTYRATVELGYDWSMDSRGAYLELGVVHGGVQVFVNGRRAHPASVPAPRIDIGRLLKRGNNVIEVELTTTLKNRLVALGRTSPSYRRFRTRSETQPYGLLGPVRLVAYSDRPVPGR